MMNNRIKMKSLVVTLLMISSLILPGCSKLNNTQINDEILNYIDDSESISEYGINQKIRDRHYIEQSIIDITSKLDNQNIETVDILSRFDVFTMFQRHGLELYGDNIVIDEYSIGFDGVSYYTNIKDKNSNSILSAIRVR